MSSPTASPQYSDLYRQPGAHVDLASGQVRLVKLFAGTFYEDICCSLSVASSTEARYEALSYTWGSKNDKMNDNNDEWEDMEGSGSEDDEQAAVDRGVKEGVVSKSTSCDHVDIGTQQPRIQIDTTTEDVSSMRPREQAAPFIYVGMTPIPVMPNLVLALRHIRSHTEDKILWIDYLCINQDSVLDRNTQVRQMDMIYNLAQNVIIWLGPSSQTSDAALDVLRQMSMNSHLTEIYKRASPRDLHRALQNVLELLSRPWWSRIWVVQEAVLAKEVVVQIGLRTVPWDLFVVAARAFRSHTTCCAEVIHPIDLGQEPDDFHLIRVAWADVLALVAASDPELSLHHALRLTHNREATDPRDKVFGLLGLVSPERRLLQADYNLSVQEVYEQAALAIIRDSGSSSILLDIDQEVGEVHDLAYWSPDWTQLGVEAVNLEAYFAASGSLRANVSLCGPHVLRTEGLRFDDIIAYSHDVKDSEKDHVLLRAYKRLQQWEKMAAPDSKPTMVLTVDQESRSEYRDFWLDVKSYPSGPARKDAFWRTVMMDLTADRSRRLTDNDYVDYKHWRAWLSRLDDIQPDKVEALIEEGNTYKTIREHNEMLTNYIEICSFFLTDDGFMGMGPDSKLLGIESDLDIEGSDFVAVLAGCNMPFVVRRIAGPCKNCPDSEFRFQIMGWAYVHGIMDGETVREIEKEEMSWLEMCMI